MHDDVLCAVYAVRSAESAETRGEWSAEQREERTVDVATQQSPRLTNDSLRQKGKGCGSETLGF